MKRVLVRKPGGHAALEVVEEDAPVPGPGEVRVAAAAIGVNFADCIVRMGYYEAAKGLYPLAPGFEFAGRVDAVGAGVSAFKEGDAVFGITRFGAYAEKIVVPAAQLWPRPRGWSDAQAAAFPAVFLTAYYGLHRAARVFAGETLLVHSAAGGAGGALCRLGALYGCRVIGVVGAARKRELARTFGAAEVIAREREELWPAVDRLAPDGFDAIFDANGVATLREGFARLKPGGRLVVYGFAELLSRGAERPGLRALYNYLRVPSFSPLKLTGANKGVIGFNVVYLFEQIAVAREAMAKMLEWIGEGKIEPMPVSAFALADAARAHAALESGTTQGKLVLTV